MFTRRLIPLLFLFALLIPLAIQASPAVAEDSPPPPPEKPNVIVMITDDQFAESVGIMRNVLANPGGRWFNFTKAFTVDSIGGVSRVTLLTGQYTHNHRITGNKNAKRLRDRDLLPVWFKNEGYYTAFLGKYLNGFPNKWGGKRYVPAGWDYFEYLGHKRVDTYNETAVRLINDAVNNHDAPFFLYVAHRAPQRKATPPERYENADVSIIPLPETKGNFNEEDMSDKPKGIRKTPMLKPGGHKRTINGYPGYMWDTRWIVDEFTRSLQQTMAIDDGIQMIIDTLTELGELENTIIFFTSDSGYSWGSHRRVGRGCPYEECNQIPFLVFYPYKEVPEVPDGETPPPIQNVDRVVANVDITATLIELAGLTPLRQPQNGNSLLPLLTAADPNDLENTPWPDMILVEQLRSTGYSGIRTQEWKYIKGGDKFLQLYDLVNDPFEMENKAYDPLYAEQIASMAAQLDALLAADDAE